MKILGRTVIFRFTVSASSSATAREPWVTALPIIEGIGSIDRLRAYGNTFSTSSAHVAKTLRSTQRSRADVADSPLALEWGRVRSAATDVKVIRLQVPGPRSYDQ